MQNAPDGSITMQNLEAALAGESMAYIKYRYFAKICRAMGDEETATIFENTADQEVQHAFGHMDLLYPAKQLDSASCLELAIEGETYEYTEMYPQFRHLALQEGNSEAVAEFDHQIEESIEHAQMFADVLKKAEKRFAALTRVEEKHAHHYRDALKKVHNG